MIFLIGCVIIGVVTISLIVRSKKSFKIILAEAKCEVRYNFVGCRAILQDFTMKGKNKTDLPSKSGKVAVITGGTRGIGLAVIKMLLKCDITVVIGCRNVELGKTLINNFRAEGITTGKIDVFKLDISVLNSVEEFATAVKEVYPKIQYLINNAGIMFGPYIETRDGLESQLSTNYLGHFFLSHLLLPHLKAAGEPKSMARIVNVTSCAHVMGKINFEDINNRDRYIAGEAYAQSKLAQVLFTKHLDNLLRKDKAYVQVHAVHPGIVNTDLFNGTILKNVAPWIPALLFKNAEQGAIPIVHACLSPELEEEGGSYIHNCKIFPASDSADAVELQKELYEFTKKLLKNYDKDIS